MKKILITGAGGYIGSIASQQFLSAGFEVVAVDNFSAGYHMPLEILQKKFGKHAIRFYLYDLRNDLTTLFKKEKKIDAVIHFAGVCSIDESMKDPMKYFSNNLLATQNLLESMRKYEVPKIIFSSSCSVYKESKSEKERIETDPLEPGNPYGLSKMMAEQVIDWYSKQFGISCITLRYFNVCGAIEDGSFGDSKKPSQLLVHNAVLGALGLEPFFLTFPHVKTKDGSPVRDYINVLDLIDAHLRSLLYLEKKSKNDTFNIGTGVGHSVLEVIQKVETYSKKRLEIKQSAPRLGDYAKRVASYKKAKEILNWKPKRTLDESIIATIKWYQTHPRRWVS